MREWHNKYKDDGLVVIGNHMPEFSRERDIDNVKEALVRLDVPYAVAIDNEALTWRAYSNRYWPTIYLIDKQARSGTCTSARVAMPKPSRSSRRCWPKHSQQAEAGIMKLRAMFANRPAAKSAASDLARTHRRRCHKPVPVAVARHAGPLLPFRRCNCRH